MKKRILFGAGIALFSALSFSCSKDDGPNGEVGNNYFSVKIDGKEKTFPIVEAAWVEGGNYLMISAMDNGKESVMISVMSDKTRVPAGTYTLQDNSGFSILAAHNTTKDEVQVNSTASRDTDAPEDSFNLKIDNINNNLVEGTFSGTLIRVQGLETLGSTKLTDGKFKTNIQPN